MASVWKMVQEVCVERDVDLNVIPYCLLINSAVEFGVQLTPVLPRLTEKNSLVYRRIEDANCCRV